MPKAREQFFSLPSLLTIGVLTGLALFALFPRQAVFEDIHFLDRPDALSIAYLRVLVRADPESDSLRINLAHMLSRTGQRLEAERVLAPLMMRQQVSLTAMQESINLLKQRVFELKPGPTRDQAQQRLFRQVSQVPEQPYVFAEKMGLIDALGPALSATQFDTLLQQLRQQAESPAERFAIARQMARLRESQGEPGAAASVLLSSLNDTAGGNRKSLVDDVIRLQLAQGKPRSALTTFRQQTPPATGDEQALSRGIRLAHMAGDTDVVAQWLEQLASLKPGDTDLQRELLASQLARGNTDGALGTVRRLQRYPARLSVDDQTRIARVLEWSNRPTEALPVWIGLYRATGDAEALARGEALARSLFDWQQLDDLLHLAETNRDLGPDAYLLLTETRIRDGQIESAMSVLNRGLQRFPQSRTLRDRKLSLLLNTRDFKGAISELESRPALSDSERLQLAELYWRVRQPEAAFAALDFEAADPAVEADVQTMRLRLGNYLGRTQQMRQDYLSLLSRAEQVNPQVQEQLLQLAVLFGDYSAAKQLSELRFATTGDTRYLAAGAEYASAQGQWDEVSRTLDRWLDQSPDAAKAPRYWILRALTAHQQSRIAEADEAYRKAYRLLPDDVEILAGWAWLQMSDVNRFGDTLPVILARLSANPQPESYPVLAYGYSALDQPRTARIWFLRGLDEHRDDADWLLSTASVLEQTGAGRQADTLRSRIQADQISRPSTRVAYYQQLGLDRLARITQGQPVPEDQPEARATRQSLAQQAYSDDNALLAEAWLAQAPDVTDSPDGRLLYSASETRREQAARLNRQLDPLNSEDGAPTGREQLRDTITLHQQFPRNLQLGTGWQDLGNFTVRETALSGRYALDLITLGGELRTVAPDAAGRLVARPDAAAEGSLNLTVPGNSTQTVLGIGSLARAGGQALAYSLDSQWQSGDRWTLNAGLGRNERTPDSAEAWWLVGRDREYLGATLTPFSRLNLSTEFALLQHHSEDGNSLGDGYSANLTGSYSVWREDPALVVSAGYQKQQLDLPNQLPADVARRLQNRLTPGDLLTADYERVGIAARWFHGEPHADYRTTPSPRAFLEVGSGYVLSTGTPEIAIGAGLGWRVLGDDELALSGRWSSEGLDGSGRADLNFTYTLYLGR